MAYVLATDDDARFDVQRVLVDIGYAVKALGSSAWLVQAPDQDGGELPWLEKFSGLPVVIIRTAPSGVWTTGAMTERFMFG